MSCRAKTRQATGLKATFTLEEIFLNSQCIWNIFVPDLFCHFATEINPKFKKTIPVWLHIQGF